MKPLSQMKCAHSGAVFVVTNKKLQGKKKKKAKNGTELANWASQELRLEPNHMLVYLFLGQRRLDFIKLQAAVISHVDNQTKF